MTLGHLPPNHSANDALIVLDVQQDFCPGGPLAVPEGDQVVPLINHLMSRFEHVIATQDWHPKDHLSFASQHGKKPFEVIDLDGLKQILWPDHCVQNSAGAEFAHGLETGVFDEVFQKATDRRVDSYSAFFDNGHRKKTGLDDYLRSKHIRKLYFAGLALDYCVKFSVLDAISLGYDAVIITDAVRGIEMKQGDVQQAVKEMRAAGAKFAASRDV